MDKLAPATISTLIAILGKANAQTPAQIATDAPKYLIALNDCNESGTRALLYVASLLSNLQTLQALQLLTLSNKQGTATTQLQRTVTRALLKEIVTILQENGTDITPVTIITITDLAKEIAGWLHRTEPYDVPNDASGFLDMLKVLQPQSKQDNELLPLLSFFLIELAIHATPEPEYNQEVEKLITRLKTALADFNFVEAK